MPIGRGKLLLPLVIVIALALSASVLAWKDKRSIGRTPEANRVSSKTEASKKASGSMTADLVSRAPQQLQRGGPVQMVRFTLFDNGIYPSSLRIHAGVINLAIEDKTNSSAGLIVEQEAGNALARIGQVRRFPNHWRGRELLNLLPGRYRITDASKSRNQAELLVEP